MYCRLIALGKFEGYGEHDFRQSEEKMLSRVEVEAGALGRACSAEYSTPTKKSVCFPTYHFPIPNNALL